MPFPEEKKKFVQMILPIWHTSRLEAEWKMDVDGNIPLLGEWWLEICWHVQSTKSISVTMQTFGINDREADGWLSYM